MGAAEERALLGAARRGDAEAVRAALAGGGDVSARSRGTGRTALIEAVIADPGPEVVQLLLDAGADPDARCTAVGLPALAWTAGRPNGAVSAAVLLAAGADVEWRQVAVGATPLHWAASAGDLALVRLLLDAGADVGALDSFGRGALARAQPHPDVVAVLRASGAAPCELAVEPVVHWPEVDPGRPDHDDPVALVRGFVLAMDAWEGDVLARLDEPGSDWSTADVPGFAAAVADPFLAPRRRPYAVGSVGTPHRFRSGDALHEVRRPTRSRAELVVRQPSGAPVRSERVFVVVRGVGADSWYLDAVRERRIVFETRFRNLLRTS